MKVAALIVAAGRGSRFGGVLPKQYQTLHGRPVLRHSLATFHAHPRVRSVLTVIHPDDQALYEAAAAGLPVLSPVFGGAERQDSVRLGLEALVDQGFDAVLIHDGARPFVSWEVIDRVITALETTSGAIPAVPVSDTLKRAGLHGVVEGTVPRAGLWRAQTPQGFRLKEIVQAHQACRGQVLTDDAAVAESVGMSVALVPGEERNLKMTHAPDLAAVPPPSLVPCVGSGFDVHGFCAGDFITLCGKKIPHDFALKGHSDADVALHALTDALYGVMAAGDIGRFFPPSEARWKGCPSHVFLNHAKTLLEALGGVLVNVDLTIICEAPKIGPHRAAMAEHLADLLHLSRQRVSVKATTTETLGFTGRREGIAVQAQVLAMMPDLS